MSWLSSFWSDITGKKDRKEVKKARGQALGALSSDVSSSKGYLDQMPGYTAPDFKFENYQLPASVQKRMNIIRGTSTDVINDQVKRSLGTMSQKGMDTSGVGMALASKIRKEGGRALSGDLANLEHRELNTARSFFLQDSARKSEAAYRNYLSKVNKLRELAGLYKDKGVTEANILKTPLPASRSPLGFILDIGTKAAKSYAGIA